MKNGKSDVPKSVSERGVEELSGSSDFDWWKHEDAAIFLQIYWINPVTPICGYLNL